VGARFRRGKRPRLGSRLVWTLARQRTLQLFAAMAETRADVWLRKRIRLGGQMVGQSLRLRPLPMASEVVVGLPRHLRIPRLRIWLFRVRVP